MTPPTVKPSDIAFSLTKPRFSSSPWTMFSVSNNDFIAALALQSEMPSPTRNVSPSVCDPFEATRVSCSRATSMAPPGRNPPKLIEMFGDRRGIGEQPVHCDQRRDGRKDGQYAVVGHAGRQRHDPVFRYVRIDPQQDVLPAARGDLRGSGRLSAASIGIGGCRFFSCLPFLGVLAARQDEFGRNGESEQGEEGT